MVNDQESIESLNFIANTNILVQYLLTNWFHTVRQPLTIISTTAGLLQIHSMMEDFQDSIFSPKLQEVQNQSRRIEETLNEMKFFLSANHDSIEKISVHIKKMFDLMGRDFHCWSINNSLNIVYDFHTAYPVTVSLIIAVLYKSFGIANSIAKNSSLKINKKECICADRPFISCLDQATALLFDRKQENLKNAIIALMKDCKDVDFCIQYITTENEDDKLSVCLCQRLISTN